MSSGHSRQLAFLNDVIEEDFYFDAAIGAVALRTNKGRRPDAGVRAICAVLSILSGLAIQTVCAVTNILRLAFLNDAVDAYIDFYAAIGAAPLEYLQTQWYVSWENHFLLSAQPVLQVPAKIAMNRAIVIDATPY